MNIKEKKVTCFIASMRGTNSREYEVLSPFLQELKISNKVELIMANQIILNHCCGCCQCFECGVCPQDNLDDMGEIKRKLIESDIIIISSPVYIHHISGIMKDFIDRIAYWSHVFELLAKRIIVCSATETTGNEYVIAYIKKVFQTFGGYVVGEISINKFINDYSNSFSETVNNIKLSYEFPDKCKTSSFQEGQFATLKDKHLNGGNTYEAIEWFTRGYLNYDSMYDLLRNKL